MKFSILLAVSILVIKLTYAADTFDCKKEGCTENSECPTDAYCVAVTRGSDCGLCLCKAGYRTEGTQCVPNTKKDGGSGQATTTASNGNGNGNSESDATSSTESGQDTSTGVTSTDSSTTTTPSGPTTQGPPPTAGPIVCQEYNCTLPSHESDSNDDDPFVVRARLFNETNSNCKRKLAVPGRTCNMKGGGQCFGVYCLTIEPENDYCICAYDRIDRQCAVDKPGACEKATGQLPPAGYKAQNKRFVNKNNPDNGSIYGRHFAANIDDCVKLCQWSQGGCRSVNFGQLAGQNVCELLSITVAKGSILEGWLVDAQGWQYVQAV